MYSRIYDPENKMLINTNSKRGLIVLGNYIGGSTKKELIENADIYAPATYFEGLNKEETKKRLTRMKKGKNMKDDDPEAYKDFETDFRNGKRIKTKPSRYTKQWNKYFPNAKSLEEKAEMTGVPLYIVKKVFDKGMAAWKTGHRPGANVHQWGYARVHSFLVKGKTFYTTDRKLALEAMAKSEKAKIWFDWVEGLCDNKSSKNKLKWCKNACKKIKCK